MAIENIPVWSFQADWENNVVETLEFFTNILTSRTGAEQRRANRNTPRRMVEFDVTVADAERSMMQNFIRLHGGKEIYLPTWFDQYETIANSPAGAKNVFFPIEDQNVMLGVGDKVFITNDDPLDYELGEIASFATDKIVLVSNLVKTWPIGSRVYRMVKARFTDQPSISDLAPSVSQGTVRFMVREPNPLGIANPNVLGPLVTESTYYVSHSYHDLVDPTGRTEEQFMFSAAMFAAYDALKDEVGEEWDEASRFYLELAQNTLDAIGDGTTNTPILRAPVNANSEILNLPHYRFAARSNAPVAQLNLTEAFTAVDNQIFIQDFNQRGNIVNKIWRIYPTTAELHFEAPWSRAFDYETPTVDVSFIIDEWTEDETGVTFPLPMGVPDEIDDWNVVYSFDTSVVVEIGNAFKLLPAISPMRAATSAYAGEISHWSERALTRAIAMDARAGLATYWSRLRAQYRKTDIKGRHVNDQRWIFEQMPNVAAIPAINDIPKGFFCYSTNAGADAPIGIEATDASWTGYNFISRDANGDWIATVPADAVTARTQIGRVFADQWRQSESFQAADQYLYVQVACNRKPVLANGDYFLVWASSKDDDDEGARWFADIGSKVAFVATTLGSGTVIDFLIPITDFKKRSYNSLGVSVWGATMPAGQILKSFGISAEFKLTYSMRLRSMRLLSGVDAAWVSANLTVAKRGYPMPFAPGVAPSLTNLAMDQQRFLGENFSPLHGYQFPDFWKIAEAEANAIYPGLAVTDLPIPARPSNVIGYPISPTTTVGAFTKTPAALLMEQQLTFLDHAQKEYDADGGDLGPFAHTYTMNTYDRFLFDDPAHSKWVYENVRPYTQWGGFQYRIAESLAQTIDVIAADTTFWDSRTLAMTLLTGFITWINTAWPNLDGVYAGFDGLRVFSGDEADYAHRFSGDENPFVEVYSE